MSADTKAQLSQIKSDTTNAYQHLQKVIMGLALDQKGVEAFEEQSFAARRPAQQEIVFKIKESYANIKDYETSMKSLLGKINTGTPEQPQEPASINFVPDLMEQYQIFERLGVGFGEDETYRIYKSLAYFSVKKGTKQLRLWGKIIGTDKDYYVAEGLADGGDDPGELAPDTEAKGVGANKMIYWVSTSLCGDWTQLPIVTPNQIKTARKIKYLFTGDLKRPILANPIFNGTEAHLLKCQIVRINSACSIIPKGIYSVNAEDAKEIEFAENSITPEVSQLASKQNWVYFNPSLLKNGRISHMKPEGMEEEEAEKELKKMMEKDPLEPRLKTIAMNGENWVLRTVGLEETYKTLGKNPKTVSKGIVGVKNLTWPGWTTAGWEGKFSSIYVGYGHKSMFTYFPREPEIVLAECGDRNEVVMNL